MKNLLLVSYLSVLACINSIIAQDNRYTGTFMTPNGAVTLQIKAMESEYHGVLVSSEGMFALKANASQQELAGTVFTNVGNYSFIGTPIQGGLQIVSEGITYTFYQTAITHELAELDLTPYFVDTQQAKTEPSVASKTPSSTSSNTDEEKELFQYIAGSQLVYYQRTSYVNDNTASSITYINFCADGRFNLNYDGGFSVEGNYGGNAQGVSRGSTYGTWHLDTQQGVVVGILNFADGTQSVQAINKNYLAQGRWRIGNTQYALVRNKAVCR